MKSGGTMSPNERFLLQVALFNGVFSQQQKIETSQKEMSTHGRHKQYNKIIF